MKKFEIIEKTAELKRKDLGEMCTQNDEYPKVIFQFEDIDQAKEALKGYSSYIYSFSSPISTLYNVTEYYVVENEYDEDGEWIDGGDVWAVTPFPSVEE